MSCRRISYLTVLLLLSPAALRAQTELQSPDEPPQAISQLLYGGGALEILRDEAVSGPRDFFNRVFQDFERQYTGRRLYALGGTLAAAAVLANTHADQAIQNWYQDHIRSPATNEVTRVANFMGDHYLTGTVAMSAWGVGRLTERLLGDRPLGAVGAGAGDWGNRTMRGMLVGCPTVGVLQVALGASRPDEGRGSRWRPFQDTNSVSGHVFVAAVPFLTASRMSESMPLKAAFFGGSFLVAMGRINNDDHYFSQVLLGWTIAYLATGSVAETDAEVPYRWRIVPLDIPNGTGLGLEFRY